MAFRFSEGQGLEQVLELAAGYGVGIGVGALVTPIATELQKAIWHQFPSMPVDAPTMALLARRQLIPYADAAKEAANTGFDTGPFERLFAATAVPLTTDVILELWRRGFFDDAGARAALERTGLDPRYLDQYAALKRNLLSVADLAMARQQEFIGDDELHARAALVGYTADDAELFFKMAGLPPGITVGLELLRRGEIDEARLSEYVAEGHTKTKYTGDILKLRYTPLSAAIAAELLLRERISEEDAVAIGEKNGIHRDDFLRWSAGLGRPPGIMEALTLVNRGVVGPPDSEEARAFFREVVARSDVRTEYADDLYHLRIHYPPLFQVARALNNSTVDPKVAADTLEKEGYPKEWVDAIVGAHANGAAAKVKELAASIVETLYEAGLESRVEATKALEALKYTEAQAADLLELWLARRIVAELVRAVSIIRTRYVGWKTDRVQTVADLDAVLNDQPTRERLLGLWDLEREANAPVLTHAQVGEALKYGRFTLDEALSKWQAQGFTLDDATTLAWIEAKGDPHAGVAPPAAAGQ